MNRNKLAALLSLTLSFELMVAPLIPSVQAQTTNPPTTAPSNSGSNSNSSTMNSINQALNTLGAAYNQMSAQNAANQVSPQMTSDMANFQSQQAPQPDKYFNYQKLATIPGLTQYLALNGINPAMLDCKTLPTTLFEAKPEVCRIGVTADKGNSQMQINQMFTYYNQYFQVSKVYKNYSADSNSDGQAFGLGCMNNAMNILNGFFKYRLDELDKLTTNLEAMNNQFREASRSDLDAIEESVAVLDGNSAIADKVRTRKPDLFDFSKRFNNAACNSMFTGNELNTKGTGGGLNKIKNDLKETLSSKGKNGKYSGESYSKLHTSVVEDLESLADKVSKQFELNYTGIARDPQNYSKFLSELPDMVSSTSGANRSLSPDLFSDVQTKFTESYVKLNDQKNTVASELRAASISSEAATNLLGNLTSNNFDSEIYTIENTLKNKCFDDSVGSGRTTLLNRIYDPTSSNHANKYASNFLKDKLNQILDNKNTSLETKLSQLQAIERETGSRYFMRMENAYEVQDVDASGKLTTSVIEPSTQRTPSAYFSDLIRNCNAQFKSNKLNNKMSGASAIQKLKELNQSYKDLAKTQASDMKKEVRKKLIECTSPEIANNTTPGSCTTDRFDTSAPGFCANAAFSCSKNMQACSQQAEKLVQEIKTEKTARVNNYKNLMQKNKQDIVKIFDSALTRYMKDAETIRGVFGAGFSSPTNISREVPEGDRYMSEFKNAKSIDGALLLEDPDKYVAMFKQNITALKASVKSQQDQILGGETVGKNAGLLADHINKTKRNYETVSREAQTLGDQCLANHDQTIKAAETARNQQQQDAMKKSQELGEKRDDYCNRWRNIIDSPNPAPFCEGVSRETFSAMRLQNDMLTSYCASHQGTATSDDLVRARSLCRANGSGDVTAAEIENSPSAFSAQRAFNTAKKNLDDAPADATTARLEELRAAKVRAENTLNSEKAKIRTARAGQSYSSSLAQACDDLTACMSDRGTPATASTSALSGCTTEDKTTFARDVIRTAGTSVDESSVQVSMENMPQFCSGVDNSNRSILERSLGISNGVAGNVIQNQ